MKLTEAFYGYEVTRKSDLSPATLEQYKWAFKILLDFSGDIDVEKINVDMMRRFFNYLHDSYKPNRKSGDPQPLTSRSREAVWISLRSFFNWAEIELDLKTRPDKSIPRPRYKPPEIEPFTDEEVLAILRACERTKVADTANRKSFTMRRRTAARDLTIISVLMDTGIRASELSRLNVGDVDMADGTIKIQPYGTGVKTKPRSVVMGKSTARYMWRYLVERDKPDKQEPLFVSEHGHRLTRDALLHLIVDLGEKAGVPDCHPHRFRHTFAVFFLRNGGNVFDLQALLGHSTLEMVQRYIKVSKSDLINSHKRASPMDKLVK